MEEEGDSEVCLKHAGTGRAVREPRESIELIRLPELANVEVMDVQNVARQWAYFHETYSFCAVGRVESRQEIPWKYRLRTHLMTGDGVMMMEPGELHANLWAAPRSDFRVLLLAPELVSKVAAELGWKHSLPPHLRVAQLRQTPLRALLITLMANVVDERDPERAESGLYRLLHALSEAGCLESRLPPAARERGRRPLRLARELLHAEWNHPVSLSRLSQTAGLPVSTLERAFRESFGTTPRQYQNHLRLIRGKELLRTSTLFVQEAAARCGFRDPKYFSRLFRREFGCAPQAYRTLAGEPPHGFER